MNVVGYLGVIGSGKDYASQQLVQQGYTKLAFADPLRKLCFDATGWNYSENIMYSVFKENYWHSTYKRCRSFSGRELLERVGQSAQELFGSDFWCRAWEQTVLNSGYEKVVVSDVRYKVEVRTLLKYNAKLYFCDYRSNRYELRNTAPEQLAQHLKSVGFVDRDDVTSYLTEYISKEGV